MIDKLLTITKTPVSALLQLARIKIDILQQKYNFNITNNVTIINITKDNIFYAAVDTILITYERALSTQSKEVCNTVVSLSKIMCYLICK